MPTDPMIDRWLEKWEARQRADPSVTPDEFIRQLGSEVPDDLCDGLRRAIAELNWIADYLGRMKEIDREAAGSPHGPDACGREDGS